MMNCRIRFARFLLRLGDFLKSLPLVTMRPPDLVEFSRQSYAKPADVEGWAEDALVDSGLEDDELELLAALPCSSGDLLLLGVGGGREAIPLARQGFRVTGVDYVPAMVARAVENAAKRGVAIQGLVQEISQLQVPAASYDVVWISRSMYSCVPTRARRVEMVRRIADALRPGGSFLCQFSYHPGIGSSRLAERVRRGIAMLTFGNVDYELGDILWQDIEFLHHFRTEDAIRSELEEGGLEVLEIRIGRNPNRSGAVCRKAIYGNAINPIKETGL